MICIRILAAVCALVVPLSVVPCPAGAEQALAAARGSVIGPKLPSRSWLPERKPEHILLCIHGLGFSSESFKEFGKMMSERGLAVFAIDVRGFGAWLDNHNGNDDKIDFEACLTDIHNQLKSLRAAYPRTPIYIVGESMGGAIGLRAASRWPQMIAGLIASDPPNTRYSRLSDKIKVGVKYLADKEKPVDAAPLIVERATEDPDLQDLWESDKENRMELTPAELKDFSDFIKGNHEAAATIKRTPVLLLAGLQDKLVKPEGTIDLFNNLACNNKGLFVVGNGEHLLLEEGQMTDQLATLLVDWMKTESYKQRKSPPRRAAQGQ